MRMHMRIVASLMLIGACCAEDAPAFKQAIEPRTFSFPADHAAHAGFQTEWWYVTGNVMDDRGRRFGYQFTVFRRAVDAKEPAERGRASAWAAGDMYLLHVAVSAIDLNAHADAESLQRGVLGLAGATEFESAKTAKIPGEIKVWMPGVEFVRSEHGWTLKARADELKLELELNETAPPLLHGAKGAEGLSLKGPKPGQASYYYSVPYLKTTGTIGFNKSEYKIVEGASWMDHEFGSNQLSAEQSGWVWICAHLGGGRALMLYVLRNKDGSIEPRSSGTWMDSDGSPSHLPLNDFELTPGSKWKSPAGQEYALEWTIKIPGHAVELKLDAAMDDQEFRSTKGAGINYYEGAAKIDGTIKGARVKGEGYLEITSGTLGGRL